MQRIKQIAVLLCATLIVCAGNAQTTDRPKKNALSFELGKTGLIFNLFFDHRATTNFGFRIGAGSNFATYLEASSFGGGAYYLVGKTNQFLELGIDLQYLVVNEVSDDQKRFTFVYPDYSTKTFYPSLNIGARIYEKTTLFRAGFAPGLIDGGIVPGGYISFGLRL